jgi:hypothetical protein
VQTLRAVRDITGSMLNKIEVGVHFFQVYALMIVLTLNIPWPNLWSKIKSAFDWPGKLFNIDLVGAFAMIDVKLRPEIQSYVRFGVIMALPLLFFGIYAKARTMDSRVWYGDFENLCRGCCCLGVTPLLPPVQDSGLCR